MRSTILFLAVLGSLLSSSLAIAHDHDAHPEYAQYVTDSLAVQGSVRTPLQLSVDDLRKLPQKTVPSIKIVNMEGKHMDDMKNVKGVLLRDILQKASIIAPASNDVKKMVIIVTASDNYKVVFTWSEVFNTPIGNGAIVYYEKNNGPLGNEEGHIAMISTQDLQTGPRHVKWLKSLEVKKIVE